MANKKRTSAPKISLSSHRIARAVALLLALVFALGSLISCAPHYGHCELGIRLRETYKDYDTGGAYDVAYSDGTMIVGVLRFSFAACLEASIPITMTQHKWAEFYIKRAEGMENLSEIKTEGDTPYFTYNQRGNDSVSYRYLVSFYITPNAYFVITFIYAEGYADKLEPEALGYIRSVYLVENYKAG